MHENKLVLKSCKILSDLVSDMMSSDVIKCERQPTSFLHGSRLYIEHNFNYYYKTSLMYQRKSINNNYAISHYV